MAPARCHAPPALRPYRSVRRLLPLCALFSACFSPTNAIDGSSSPDAAIGLDAPPVHSDALSLDPDAGHEDAATEEDAAAPGCGRAWCWVEPFPQGNTLNSISGTSTSSVFAVGERGSAVLFDGRVWRNINTGTTTDLNDVAAAGDRAYVVGNDGLVLRYVNRQWTTDVPFTRLNLNAVWADIFGRVWAAGDAGIIYSYFEASWVQTVAPAQDDLLDIAGVGSGELWTAGGNTIQRWNGERWEIAHRSRGPVTAIASPRQNEVWAGGDPMLHFDGQNWTEYELPPFAGPPRSIDVLENGAVLAQVPLSLPNGAPYVTIYFTGTRFDFWPFATTSDARALDAIGGEAWFAGEKGSLLRWDGARTVDQRGGGETRVDFNDHWISPSGTLWAAGGRLGGSWWYWYRNNHWRVTSNEFGEITSMWGLADDDFWFATSENYLHWDGDSWTEHGAPAGTIHDIFGFDNYDIWAAGERGTIQHWDGVEWRTQRAPTAETLRAVWGPDRDQVWAVGEGGTILQFDGGQWRVSASTSSADLYAVHGTSRGDIWAVGEAGTILRFNGSRWNVLPKLTSATLRAVHALSPFEVIIAGDQGSILRWDGARLHAEDSGATRDLTFVLPAVGAVWAGAGLSILRWTRP